MSDVDLMEDNLDFPAEEFRTGRPALTGHSLLSKDSCSLSIGVPQLVRGSRDSYYVYPILSKDEQLVTRRYSDFFKLQAKLAEECPGCMTTSLPEKEGLSAYWSSQDPDFYLFRRFGLEQFLKRVAAHAKLSQTQSFEQFLREDSAFRCKESTGWLGRISDISSYMTSAVSSYVYGEHFVLQSTVDKALHQQRNEFQSLYQNLLTLSDQGKEMVRQNDAEISSNYALSKAYESMAKVETEELAVKLKVMAEAHFQVAEVQKASFSKLKELVGQEMEDYRRFTLGLLDAFDRRNKLRAEEVQGKGRYDLQQVDEDLRQAIEDFSQEKNFLSQLISSQIVLYKQEVTERLAQVWREAYGKVFE